MRRSVKTPAILLSALAAVALSGCTGVAAPLGAQAPDQLVVRAFVDDLDGDGERELHIRLAAATGSTVHRFRGAVDVLLVPEDGGGWVPRAWRHVVDPSQFTDAVLPYYEITAPADSLAIGTRIDITAEARLTGGHFIDGKYTTWA